MQGASVVKQGLQTYIAFHEMACETFPFTRNTFRCQEFELKGEMSDLKGAHLHAEDILFRNMFFGLSVCCVFCWIFERRP